MGISNTSVKGFFNPNEQGANDCERLAKKRRAAKRYAKKYSEKKSKHKPAKETFFNSRKWLELRYRVLDEQGRKCACCRTKEGRMHVDHIKPRSKYPELELQITNLQVLCEDCNIGKGNWNQTDWRKR